jgi:hypothetical protein
MKDLTETFLIAEALFDLAAPDFPLMREEWAAAEAAEAADQAWNDSLNKWYEEEYDREMNRYMYPELS